MEQWPTAPEFFFRIVGAGAGGPNVNVFAPEVEVEATLIQAALLTKFQKRVQKAIAKLIRKLTGKISQKCKDLFASLGTTIPRYLAQLNAAKIEDASTATQQTLAGLSQQNAYQNWLKSYIPWKNQIRSNAGLQPISGSTTIAAYFSTTPGLRAWTPGWNIQTIFIRKAGAVNAALLGHEGFHLDGIVDSEIQSKWKLPQTASVNITRHFRKTCL